MSSFTHGANFVNKICLNKNKSIKSSEKIVVLKVSCLLKHLTRKP